MIGYPDEIDCIWVGSDSNGFVAAFVTAGFGCIPWGALKDAVLPIENIELSLAELPSISDANLLISYPRPDDFIALAQKGLFVYDWPDVHRVERDYARKYEKVAAPTNPVLMQKLPPLLRASTAGIKFNLLFSQENFVRVEDHFQPWEIEAPSL